MGFDVRDIPAAAVTSLPDHLRRCGFEVVIASCENRAPAGGIVTRVTIRRGVDEQLLSWVSLDSSPGIRRISIHNQSAWLPWVRRRRLLLQADVTKAIEDCGGYRLFAD